MGEKGKKKGATITFPDLSSFASEREERRNVQVPVLVTDTRPCRWINSFPLASQVEVEQ